jgi:hypothetical protein
LASTLVYQTRYEEAEVYARSALQISPTNPFIIDCLCEIKIKQSRDSDALQQDSELWNLMNDLKRYGEFEGHSFYDNRMASYYLSLSDCTAALESANAAVTLTPSKFSVLLNRSLIAAECGNLSLADKDLVSLRKLVNDDSTGEGKTGAFWTKVLAIKLDLCRRNYHGAIRIVESDHEMPQALHQQMCANIAWFIENDSAVTDARLKNWIRKQ